MAQLYYSPVQRPVTGNGASAVTQAAAGISSGLATIGAGITKLGERREQRQQDEYNRKKNAVLEAIGLEAANITDENALNQLGAALARVQAGGPATAGAPAGPAVGTPGQGGVGQVSGVAALIAGRRGEILDQAKSRADTASVLEDTRGERLTNDDKSIDLLRKQNVQDLQTNEADALLNFQALAQDGKLNEATAAFDAWSKGVSGTYGADAVGAARDAIFSDLTQGDDARTGVLKNQNEVNQGLADIAKTNADTGLVWANTRNTDASTDKINQQITEANYDFGQKVLKDDRAWAKLTGDDQIDESAARILRNSFTKEEALAAVDGEILSNEQKRRLQEAIYAEVNDPNWQDKYHPLDPLNTTQDRNYTLSDQVLAGERPISDLPTKKVFGFDIPQLEGSNSKRDIPSVVASIEGMRNQLISSNDETLGIYNEAKAFTGNLADEAGNIANFETTVTERYGSMFRNDADRNKFMEQVRQVQTQSGSRRLTDGEMLAIIDRAGRKRGANFPGSLVNSTLGIPFPGANILPGNEKAYQYTIGKKEMMSIAKAYQERSQGDMEGALSLYDDAVSKARSLDTRITGLEQERARAIQYGQTDRKEALDKAITDARDEVVGIYSNFGNATQGTKPKKK